MFYNQRDIAMVITKEEFIRQVIESLTQDYADIQRNNNSQLIIYTGVFVHSDGKMYDECEELNNNK